MKLSTRQENFCQNFVGGMSAAAAYIAAGYKCTTQPTAWANASRMLRVDKVADRVAELRRITTEIAIERTAVTKEKITEMLIEDRNMARSNNQAAAAISASMGLAKLHGHLVDKHEVEQTTHYTVSNRPQTDDQWLTEHSPQGAN